MTDYDTPSYRLAARTHLPKASWPVGCVFGHILAHACIGVAIGVVLALLHPRIYVYKELIRLDSLATVFIVLLALIARSRPLARTVYIPILVASMTGGLAIMINFAPPTYGSDFTVPTLLGICFLNGLVACLLLSIFAIATRHRPHHRSFRTDHRIIYWILAALLGAAALVQVSQRMRSVADVRNRLATCRNILGPGSTPYSAYLLMPPPTTDFADDFINGVAFSVDLPQLGDSAVLQCILPLNRGRSTWIAAQLISGAHIQDAAGNTLITPGDPTIVVSLTDTELRYLHDSATRNLVIGEYIRKAKELEWQPIDSSFLADDNINHVTISNLLNSVNE